MGFRLCTFRAWLRSSAITGLGLLNISLVASCWAQTPIVGEPAAETAVLQTVLEGLNYRESQVERLWGEGLVDSYYTSLYWSSLGEICDEVKKVREGHRDRDRVAVHFDLQRSCNSIQVQSIYWGGANMFFTADPGRAAQDVGELYLVRGTTKEGAFYHFSRQRGYPIAWYYPVADTTSGLLRGRPSIWLGLSAPRHITMSAHIQQEIDRAVSWRCNRTTWKDEPCVLLSLYKKSTSANHYERTRYWFAPEYDFGLVELERIGFDAGHAESGYRYVSCWENFAQVTGLFSPLPRRYTHWCFSYSPDSDTALDHVVDVQITRLSVEPPSRTAALGTIFPPGTRLWLPISPVWRNREVGPNYEEEKREASALWGDAHYWAQRSWEQVVPGFPADWSKGLTQQAITDVLDQVKAQ